MAGVSYRLLAAVLCVVGISGGALATDPFVDPIEDGDFVSVAVDGDGRVYALGSDGDYSLVVYRYTRGASGWEGDPVWWREVDSLEPVQLLVVGDENSGVVGYVWFTKGGLDSIGRFSDAGAPSLDWASEFQNKSTLAAARLVDFAIHVVDYDQVGVIGVGEYDSHTNVTTAYEPTDGNMRWSRTYQRTTKTGTLPPFLDGVPWVCMVAHVSHSTGCGSRSAASHHSTR